MEIPPAHHPKWIEVLTGSTRYDFESLAVKIRIGVSMVQVQHSPDTLCTVAEELRTFFVKNQQHPGVQKDLHKIFD